MTANRELEDCLLEDPSFQAWARGSATPAAAQRWSDWLDGADVDPFSDETSQRPPVPEASARQAAAEAASAILQAIEFRDDLPRSEIDVDRAWERFQAARMRRSLRKRTYRDGASASPRDADSSDATPDVPSSAEAPDSDPPAPRPPRKPRRHTHRRRSAAQRIGVLLSVLVVAGLTLWWIQQPAGPQVVATTVGERATVDLPDGTQIVLNANSRLRYDPSTYARGPRSVTLLGEALFDVTHRPDRPHPSFRVVTEDGTVRVLGTTFSVMRRGDEGTRVVLSEGRVAVDARAGDKRRDTTLVLEPGDLVSFDDDTGLIERRRVNPKVYTSWTSGVLVFDQTPVAEIVRRIESTYDVNVVVEDPALLDQVVSGSVENDLGVLVNGLSQILDRPVRRSGNRILIQ